MDKLFMHWCFTHGWNPEEPNAAEEYGLWCTESDAFGDVDMDEDGNWYRYSAKDGLADGLRLVEREQSEAEYALMMG